MLINREIDAVIVANGDFPSADAPLQFLGGKHFVVCCDGGANEYIARGYVSTDEYNELNKYLFEPYRSMGGNGTAEKLMEEVKHLPTREDGHDE